MVAGTPAKRGRANGDKGVARHAVEALNGQRFGSRRARFLSGIGGQPKDELNSLRRSQVLV